MAMTRADARPASPVKPVPVVSGVLALAVAVLGVLVLGDAGLTEMLIVVLFGVTLAPVLIAFMRGRHDWCEGVYIYTAVYFMLYGGSYLVLRNSEWRNSWLVADFEASFPLAVSFAILGYVCFALGYFSGWPDRVARRLPAIHFNPASLSRYPLITLVVYGIGWVPRLVLLSAGQHLAFAVPQYADEMASSQATFNYLAWFAYFGFAMATVYCAMRFNRVFLLVYVVGMFPLELGYAFLAGSKLFFLPILIAPVIAVNYLRRRLRLAVVAVPLVIFVLVIFPLNVAYRSVVTYGDLRLGTIDTDLPFVITEVLGELDVSDQPSGSILAAQRMAYVPILAAVSEGVPSLVELQYGSSLFAISAAVLVPTALWPTKYDYLTKTLNPFFGIWGVQYTDTSAGVAPTQVGEMYLNFHIPGIVVGMFVVGFLLRGFYVYLLDRPNPITVLVYMLTWPLIGWAVESWTFALVNTVVKNTALLLGIGWVLNGGRIFEWRRLGGDARQEMVSGVRPPDQGDLV